MLKQPTENPKKESNPTRDDMINMLVSSWEALKVDPVLALKNNYTLNKLFEIVGRQMLESTAEMMKKPPSNVAGRYEYFYSCEGSKNETADLPCLKMRNGLISTCVVAPIVYK